MVRSNAQVAVKFQPSKTRWGVWYNHMAHEVQKSFYHKLA